MKNNQENSEKITGIKAIYRKSFCYNNLYGSSRFELTSAQRGIWNDLIDLAKLSRVKPGLIAAGPGMKYPHQYIAGLLNVPIDLLEDALKVLEDTKRIHENSNGIEIVNWKKYQTDYDRQKPYREAKKAEEPDPDKFIKGKLGHMVQR